ncbi:hypothetical protein Tsubulata_016958 [Turnera subulata]|uniref:DUF4283 domain-containing protein n=1 Tax=Turnera subulata TaxID=218843 RepID=A0A9Q0G7A4_9ROSI|nr:hypothetical protein Tsubulata_016958 [Turnera subulata]
MSRTQLTVIKLKGKSTSSVQQPVSFVLKTDSLASDSFQPEDSAALVTKDSAASISCAAESSVSMATLLAINQVNLILVASSSVPNGLDFGESTLWSKVISNSSPQLSFMKPVFNDDCSALCIPPELLEIGRKKYQLCLIGQFVGAAPKIGLIHAILNDLWGRDGANGAISISSYKDGLYLFQFPNEATYLRALHRGP